MSRNRTPVTQDPLSAPTVLTKDPLLNGPSTTSTESFDNGQASSSVIMPASGDFDIDALRDQLNAPMMGDPNSIDFHDHAEKLKFMEDQMLITIHETTDPTAERIIPIGVNGSMQHFTRGTAIKTKRKFVDALARARPFNVSTPEYNDANGDRATKLVTESALKYPFTVNYDPSPKGRAWLQAVMQEG